jgi:hypothetical protein
MVDPTASDFRQISPSLIHWVLFELRDLSRELQPHLEGTELIFPVESASTRASHNCRAGLRFLRRSIERRVVRPTHIFAQRLWMFLSCAFVQFSLKALALS